jgi:lysophospholipase L1-like esterase
VKKQYLAVLVIIAFCLALVVYFKSPKSNMPVKQVAEKTHIVLTPTPTPFVFKTYVAPVAQQKQVYKIVMIGDSMTAALGPHGGALSEYMNSIYKKNPQDPQRIIIDNFAKSSNILAVGDQLNNKTTISEYTFGPLLSEDFDMILVESYGYNPLSQFGLEGGIKRQNQALDQLMKTLITSHPHAAIVFVATISPNRENYGKSTQPNMSAEDRAKLADERIAYIKNHIQYATSHNIPLINIYQKSLTADGDGNMIYINPTDDVHPSFVGIDFIDHEIGNFIFDNKILPQ